MSRIIKENGKTYTLSDDGIVTEANFEAVIEPVDSTPLKIGDRVQVEGRTGTFLDQTTSVYGDAVAVGFDNGDLGEYLAESVFRSDADIRKGSSHDTTTSSMSVDEIKELYEHYSSLPMITSEELDTKEREGRSLKLRSQALVRQSGIALGDQIALDTIIMMVDTDLRDMTDLRHLAQLDENDMYRRSARQRYRLSENVGSSAPNMGASGKEDASWLENALDGMTVVSVTDADMATTALDMVNKLDRGQLNSEQEVKMATSFREEYLGIQNDPERQAKFAAFVEEARQDKLAKPEIAKEASVENLDDFNAAALFL
jgi:hypothetical protein